MNRLILIIFVFFISGAFLQSMPGERPVGNDYIDSNEISADWKEILTDSCGIPSSALSIALNGYYDLKDKKLIRVDTLLTIIDFSRLCNEKRLFILDIKNQKIIKNTLVAHGKNSGYVKAQNFSNAENSNKSSLGLYITKETYFGKHGYSLRIEGMNEGINDNALKRAIVIHGANYVSEDYIEEYGRIGRSFGCPALPFNESKEIIDLIKGGSLLLIYHPSILPISQTALEILP